MTMSKVTGKKAAEKIRSPRGDAGGGRVSLVGAGPGDPGLLTLKGADRLAGADVVLYDELANVRLLDLAPEHAEKTLVGRRHGRVTMPQEEIERLMIEYARKGCSVVRLKGGDPFLFGRGGEEAQACRSAGVGFEIVPGVSSVNAVPAYAGIPLTHRELASSVTIVTGRPSEARGNLEYDWRALAAGGETLVFLMAMLKVDEVATRLIAAGLAAATPAAAIQWGSTPRQRTVRAGLADLAMACEKAKLRPPGVLIIGRVAALADSIGWYESLPLFGRRIVVTRPRRQAKKFAERLAELGADVIAYPTVEIAPPREVSPIREAFDRLAEYDWLVLTSVNGVERFFAGLRDYGHDVRELAGVRVAAIGPATEAAISARGLRVACRPREYRAEALLESLGDVAGQRVLLARAEVAREVLPEQLGVRGAKVDVVSLYRSIVPPAAVPLGEERIEMLTFTSSSTVDNFVAVNGERGRELLGRIPVAVIGPITADTLARHGTQAAVMPREYTVPALTRSIVAYFAKRPQLP